LVGALLISDKAVAFPPAQLPNSKLLPPSVCPTQTTFECLFPAVGTRDTGRSRHLSSSSSWTIYTNGEADAKNASYGSGHSWLLRTLWNGGGGWTAGTRNHAREPGEGSMSQCGSCRGLRANGMEWNCIWGWEQPGW
jgi:hypothetical protein